MKEKLSRVYLDDNPVTLMGDEATPPLSRIIRAGGKHPNRVDVLYLTSPRDRAGRAVGPDEVIDRTAEPTRPIYLRTVPKDVGRIFATQANPIFTADPEHALSGPDGPSAPTSRSPMPNLDPVISQLGRRAPKDGAHEEAVFRAPSQRPPGPSFPDAGLREAERPALQRANASRASALRAAALAKAAQMLGAAASRARKAKASQAQATAEGEAEQRQEDERNIEDALQDDEEAARAADEDAESRT